MAGPKNYVVDLPDVHVYFGDARDLKEVSGESVHLTITSPPYGLGIDYGMRAESQLENYDPSHEGWVKFLDGLQPVWKEIDRVTVSGGIAAINVANIKTDSKLYGKYVTLPSAWVIGEYFRQTLGWDLVSEIIWTAKRIHLGAGGDSVSFMGSYPLPLKGAIMRDIEYILLMRKPGERVYDDAARRQSALTLDEWKTYFSQIWTINGVQKPKHGGVTHPASFPLELPMRLIKMWSVKGEVVLDPFLGSGTTGLAARKLERKFIGKELNPDYEPMIEETIKTQQESMSEAFK